MSAKPDIVDIIRTLAAGSDVQWSDLDLPADQSTRAILKELEIVSRVAQSHGTLHQDTDSSDSGQPSDDGSVGHTWGPLTLLERVGAGAYGEVYRAWDTRLDREVALKLLYPDGIDSGDGTTIEEGRLLPKIRHPNVVTVYGADCVNGRFGIWTEFIDGQTLAQSLQEHGPYQPDDACAIAIEVCRGLAAVHQAGLVHGDIKSTNVMRQDDGRVSLMDFGASHHREGSRRPRVGGTPTYMAPEVLDGEAHTTRSDVYSVGVLLYYLLTKTYPVTGRTLNDLRDAHQRKQQRSLGSADANLPRRVLAVVNRALSADPMDRYASAEAMANALAAAIRTPRDVKARQGVTAAVLVASVAIVGALALWFRSPEAPTAQSRLNFAPRDYVLITKFENRTGEPVFDGAVEYALVRELTSSNVVGLLPDERIADALVLMKQPRNTAIDRRVGREVALRDGHVKALLTGRVERFGSNYVITAQLIDPANDAVVATIGETADGQNAVLPALQRQASRVRSQLGEKLSDIRGADPNIEPGTTSSLQAFQLYNQSYLLGGQGNWPAALEIIRQVVRIDPQFASGWTWLAWAMSNTNRNYPAASRDARRAELREHAARAVQLSERVPESERHWIQGSYYTLTQQPAAAIAHYEALLSLRPDHYWGLNNLIAAVAMVHRPEDYEKFLALVQLRGQLRPNDPLSLGEAALAAFRASGTAAKAKPFLDQLSRLSQTEQPIAALAKFQHDFTSAHISLRSGDLVEALAQVNEMAERIDDYPLDWRVEETLGVSTFYHALGRNQDAMRFTASFAERPDTAQSRRALARESDDLPTRQRALGPASRPPNRFIHGPDYVRAGMLDEARQYVRGNSPNYDRGLAEITAGLLSLLAGDLNSAVSRLELGVQLTRTNNNPSYWSACESLADALWRLRRRSDAINRLTECSNNDFRYIVIWAPLRSAQFTLDLHLARLHRLSGNLDKAIEIEASLRRRLALADPDHPILKQLQSH